MSVGIAPKAFAGLVMIGLVGGCVGGLLGGGKPDNLYRFGASASAGVTGSTPSAQQTILLDRVHFASEIEGDRLLAVHGGNARFIKGSRWVTTGPNLFTQALLRSFQSRAPGLRVMTMQGGDVTGFSLVVSIARFEAQYDDADMVSPPAITVEGDATLFALSDRRIVGRRHFTTKAQANNNRVVDIVTAFDRATTCFTADVADWVTAATGARIPKQQSRSDFPR